MCSVWPNSRPSGEVESCLILGADLKWLAKSVARMERSITVSTEEYSSCVCRRNNEGIRVRRKKEESEEKSLTENYGDGLGGVKERSWGKSFPP